MKSQTSDRTNPSEPRPLRCGIERKAALQTVRRHKRFDLLIHGSSLSAIRLARLAAFNGLSTLLISGRDLIPSQSPTLPSQLLPSLAGEISLRTANRLTAALRTAAPHLCQRERWRVGVSGGAQRTKQRLLVQQLMRGDLRGWREGSLLDLSCRWGRLLSEECLAARQEGAFLIHRLGEVRAYDGVAGASAVVLTDRHTEFECTIHAGVIVSEYNAQRATRRGASSATPNPSGWWRIELSRGVHLPSPAIFFGPDWQAVLRVEGEHAVWWINGVRSRRGQPSEDIIAERLQMMTANGFGDSAGSVTSIVAPTGEPDLHGSLPADVLLPASHSVAAHTIAAAALRGIMNAVGRRDPLVPLDSRALPGAPRDLADETLFFEGAARSGIPTAIIEATHRRLGGKISALVHREQPFELIAGVVMRGEIDLLVETEMPLSIDEILARLDEPALRAHLPLRAALEAMLMTQCPSGEDGR